MRSFIPAILIVVFALAAFAGLPPVAETARAIALIAFGVWAVAEAQSFHRRRHLWGAERVQADLAGAQATRARNAQDVALQTLQGEVAALKAERAAAASAQVAAAQAAAEAAAKAGDAEVVGFLSLLQQKGRFLDFIMDDVTRYGDAQIGAAARVVHQGCAGVVREYFDIKPVHAGAEGSALTLQKDYDARRYRLLGRVTGEPPVSGRVLHRGWLATDVRLPERTSGASLDVIAPAEVELS